MDTKLFEELEQIQKDCEEVHSVQIKQIESKLGLYISNYHLNQGDDISKLFEAKKKIEHDKAEILDYINKLYHSNQKVLELIKLLNNSKEN